MRGKKCRKTHQKPENIITEQPLTLYPSLGAAAAALGIEKRILQRAKRSGAPGFDAGNRVRPLEVLVWLVKQKDSILQGGAGEELDTEIKRIKLSREQFALQADQKEFIKSSDAAQWATEMVNAFVKVLDGIPGTLAPDIVGCATVADAELRIRSALDQAKATLHAAPWQ